MTGSRSLRALARPAGGNGPLRVMLAVGDELFALGLARLLADEGIAVVSELPADAVLVDRAGAGATGGAARVVALCGPGEGDMAEALAGGASAVLWRGSDAAVIASALRSAVAGTLVVPAEMAERTLAAYREARTLHGGDRAAVETLSPRERDVLSLLAAGLTNDEIATDLVVTASTVKNHVARIMSKLGARNRTHAAVIAARLAA